MLRSSFQNQWRIINYRSVDDASTAEFLHDLYNRHRPEVNSIRFRNTLCIYQKTLFTSYAPQQEWDTLACVFGERLNKGDTTLLASIRQHTQYSKPRLQALLKQLKTQPLSEDRAELADTLVQLHYTALGEIYGINLVQIEHAITWAIEQRLQQLTATQPSVNWLQLIPQLIKSHERTIAVADEERTLELSLAISAGELNLADASVQYMEEFGYVRYAYGSVNESQSIEDRLTSLTQATPSERTARLKQLQAPIEADPRLDEVRKAQPELWDLCQLAREVGELRDRNKALMSNVAHERATLMNHIAKLCEIDRRDLSRYLLLEIYDLLVTGTRLNQEVLDQRWELMVFQRQERAWHGEEAIPFLARIGDHTTEADVLKGICASPGIVTGTVKHVRTFSDAQAITPEDILVAFGTDFDLMEGLCRCAGIVTEEGGMLSHASVISRELKKPCLIGVAHVMNRLSEGTRVELDATNGVLRVLEAPSKPTISQDSSPLITSFALMSDPQQVGHKAFQIAQLAQQGYSVLPGVVIPSDQTATNISEALCHTILSHFPQARLLVVRSSSPHEDTTTHSAAGLFHTEIARAEPEALQQALQRVYAAAEQAHLRDYLGFTDDQPIPMAILIQPYLAQDWGGVAFSHHPSTGEQEVWIEASTKGAAAVVDGKPELRLCYADDEQNRQESQFQPLAELVRRLSDAMQQPVDIEWGLAENQFYLFQLRSVTTINSPSF